MRKVRPETPARLAAICARALACNPNERYATAAEMEAELQERRFIKREVASALAAHAFDVYYQPIVRADGGAIAGVEALIAPMTVPA